MNDATDVPLQRGYTGATDALRSIEVGQSYVFTDSTIYRISSLCSQLHKRFGWKYRCRSSDDKKSVKVYRIA